MTTLGITYEQDILPILTHFGVVTEDTPKPHYVSFKAWGSIKTKNYPDGYTTLTTKFIAENDDQYRDRVQELCAKMGLDPNEVSELQFVVGVRGIYEAQITKRKVTIR